MWKRAQTGCLQTLYLCLSHLPCQKLNNPHKSNIFVIRCMWMEHWPLRLIFLSTITFIYFGSWEVSVIFFNYIRHFVNSCDFLVVLLSALSFWNTLFFWKAEMSTIACMSKISDLQFLSHRTLHHEKSGFFIWNTGSFKKPLLKNWPHNWK